MALLPDGPHPAWQITKRTVAYKNPWTEVWEDTGTRPDGKQGLYGYFAPTPAIMVCPLWEDGTISLVRQWRPAYGAPSWELPGGRVEPGECPLSAAIREVKEEVGGLAHSYHFLGCWLPSDARVGGMVYGYLARGVSSVSLRLEASEVDMLHHRLPLTRSLAAIDAGEVTHLTTVALLLRVARYLASEHRRANTPLPL